MLKDKVIELDNKINYYVIEEMDINNRKFILAKMVDLEHDEIKDNDFIVKELVSDNDNVETKDIVNIDEAEAIAKLLLAKAHSEM